MILKSFVMAAVATGLGLLASGCESRRVMDQPWCANQAEIGRAECSYPTREQCMAAISGVGGVCTQNPLGPDAASRRRVR